MDSRDDIIAKAESYIKENSLQEAIKEYENLIAQEPDNIKFLLKLAELYSLNNLPQKATGTYKKGALIYSDKGQLLQAIAVYKQIIKTNTDFLPDIYISLVELYQKLGLISDAIINLKKIAKYYDEKGKHSEALKYYEQMAKLNPDNLTGKISLIDLYDSAGHRDKAIEELKSLIPELKERGKNEDLVRILEKLIGFEKDNYAAYKELSELYLALQNPKKALNYLRVCYQAEPADIKTLELIIDSFIKLEQVEKAKTVYKKLTKILKDRGQTTEIERIQSKFSNIVEDAISLFEDEIPLEEIPKPRTEATPVLKIKSQKEEKKSNDAQKLSNEASVFIKYGFKEKAIENFKRIIAENPNDVESHLKLKELYINKKDLYNAKKELYLLIHLAEESHNDELLQKFTHELSEIDPNDISASKKLEELSEITSKKDKIVPEKTDAEVAGQNTDPTYKLESPQIIKEEIPPPLQPEKKLVDSVGVDITIPRFKEAATIHSENTSIVKIKDMRSDEYESKFEKENFSKDLIEIDFLTEQGLYTDARYLVLNRLIETPDDKSLVERLTFIEKNISNLNAVIDNETKNYIENARAFMELGFFEDAIRYFKLVKLCKKEEYVVNRGIADGYKSLNNYKEAIRYLKFNLAIPSLLEEEKLENNYNLASLYELEGDLEEAKKYCEMVHGVNRHFKDIEDKLARINTYLERRKKTGIDFSR